MRLDDNDILQKGDIVHYLELDKDTWSNGSRFETAEVYYCVGMRVGEFIKTHSRVDYVERPEPEPDLREHVRILREAHDVTK